MSYIKKRKSKGSPTRKSVRITEKAEAEAIEVVSANSENVKPLKELPLTGRSKKARLSKLTKPGKKTIHLDEFDLDEEYPKKKRAKKVTPKKKATPKPLTERKSRSSTRAADLVLIDDEPSIIDLDEPKADEDDDEEEDDEDGEDDDNDDIEDLEDAVENLDDDKEEESDKEDAAESPKKSQKDAAEESEEEEEESEEEEPVKTELEVGDTIPSGLTVELQDSSKINLLAYAKKAHILVIFAYPKASTPGCTRQAQGFRDEYKEINGTFKAKVLGLSADATNAQTRFKERQNLPYGLIADTKKELITLLGCKKVPTGIVRSHFVFVDGVLKIKSIKVSPEVSYRSALEQIKELSK